MVADGTDASRAWKRTAGVKDRGFNVLPSGCRGRSDMRQGGSRHNFGCCGSCRWVVRGIGSGRASCLDRCDRIRWYEFRFFAWFTQRTRLLKVFSRLRCAVGVRKSDLKRW